MEPLAGAGLKKVLELLLETGKELLMEGRLTKKKKLALQDIKKAEQLLLSGSNNLVRIKGLLNSAKSVLQPSVPEDLTRVQDMLDKATDYAKASNSKKKTSTKKRAKKRASTKKKVKSKKASSKKTSSSKKKRTKQKTSAKKNASRKKSSKKA